MGTSNGLGRAPRSEIMEKKKKKRKKRPLIPISGPEKATLK